MADPVKILVVDDEPDLELLITQKFRNRTRTGELQFSFAENGASALEKLRDQPSVDLVLSDINMPVMDGLTLLSHMRENGLPQKTIIVSAYGDMSNIRTAMNRGAFDFITKPIDFGDLEITLNKTIEEMNRVKEANEMKRRFDQLRDEKEALILEQNRMLELKVEERTKQLQHEKQKSDELLLNILPHEVASELKLTGSAEARQYDRVSVLFTDFVNFTNLSEKLTPRELVNEIHQSFRSFDEIVYSHGLEKIKTIGDAYMAVCGLPHDDPEHALKVVRAAVDIRNYVKTSAHFAAALPGDQLNIRIGIHSGPVVAGIVGIKKFAYDIWGDTVNTAARMEQHSEPGRINISGVTFSLVKEQFNCMYRGKIDAKNKGMIDMYFVEP